MTAKQQIAKKCGSRQLAVCCNKFISSVLQFALMCMLAFAPFGAQAQFAGGDGSENSPFRITTPEQLALLHTYVDGYYSFILVNNLDMSTFDAGDGGGWLPVGDEKQRPFNGKFDGNGKTIRNLTINRPNMIQVGLFGCMRREAVVANLTLQNVNITGNEDVGALVGFMAQSCIVDNCHVKQGKVEGGISVGGLAGYSRTGSLVKNSSANVLVNGWFNHTGGLVGEMYASSVENSTSKGTVYSTSSSTGGLVGYMHVGSSVRNCYSSSLVEEMPDTVYFDNRYAGGLVGQAFTRSFIENSYASGMVIGTESVGGLIGWGHVSIHSQNNVALNPSVSGAGYVYAAQGRMERSELKRQYTRGDMLVEERGIKKHNPSSLETGINIELMESQIPFYQSIGWRFGVDERNPWVFNEATNMPMLWFEGAPATSLSLNVNMVTLYPGEVYELLAATVEPSNARLKLVHWQSTTPTIATVSAEGVVSAVSLGATDVLARTLDGGYEAICRINVIPKMPLSVEQNEMRVNIYPNPVRELLNVEASEEIMSITMYNTAGALLLERKNVGAATTSIDVSHLSSGVNVLAVRSRSGTRSLKFIVL